jgi:hypothetical protein
MVSKTKTVLVIWSSAFPAVLAQSASLTNTREFPIPPWEQGPMDPPPFGLLPAAGTSEMIATPMDEEDTTSKKSVLKSAAAGGLLGGGLGYANHAFKSVANPYLIETTGKLNKLFKEISDEDGNRHEAKFKKMAKTPIEDVLKMVNDPTNPTSVGDGLVKHFHEQMQERPDRYKKRKVPKFKILAPYKGKVGKSVAVGAAVVGVAAGAVAMVQNSRNNRSRFRQ